ncbi:MAG TPA: DNA polymerase, partial [Candidatus Paceibacterota bacterium]
MSRDTQEYERFKEITGLNISSATYYRMKREFTSGENPRLARLLEKNYSKPHERKGFNNHANPDQVPFLSFDGEGRTLEGKHKYVYLANSDGDSIYRPAGISTLDALDFLQSSGKTRRIRVFFSFGYDVQQILKDVPDADLVRIMHGEPTKYKAYTIQYLPGKIFTVNNVRFYDVFNYWQTSFINAVRSTLGPDAISSGLVHGKESRSDFASWSIDEIAKYTAEELDLLVQLCDHLRQVMLRADIHLGSAFYGPGSVANYWFKHYGINPPKIENPVLVDVMERGYYGGRFESFRLGRIEPVYECDINSAYPSVIADLPYLDGWERWSGSLFDRSEIHSIWHVRWSIPSSSRVGPFPSRDRHGLISYPANGVGWYWKPEVEAALDLYGSNCFEIIEGYNPSIVSGEPFAWVKDVYNWRLELKEKNDPAQWALKVGLNSLYGKTAQRVGSARYFSLAWAGFITSATRAKLLLAVKGRTDSLIAFATDAAYFDKDPAIPNSKKLGEWSAKRWHRGYFVQSGVYRLETANCGIGGEHVRDEDGKIICHKDAYRGFS